MFDERPGDGGLTDFDEFADHLLEQGLDVSPSEVHGCICGLLAAGGPAEPEWGLAGLSQALTLVFHGELAGQAMELYAGSAAALEDETFDFHPLLPDDEVAISGRTGALAGWCRGFLAGYALPGADGAGSPPGDCAEVLEDFAAIAEAEADGSEEEEALEESYAELVEYLRYAALNVYLDSRGREPPEGSLPPGDARH